MFYLAWLVYRICVGMCVLCDLCRQLWCLRSAETFVVLGNFALCVCDTQPILGYQVISVVTPITYRRRLDES